MDDVLTAGPGAREGVAVPERPGMERATIRQELADRILTAIAIGAYSPGDRLPSERELADLQQVSRVTVREALRIVADLGLITSRRGRDGGTFVTALDWQAVAPEMARRTLEVEIPKLAEFFDYRCLVEGLVARTAAERRSSNQAAELERVLAAFCGATDVSEARALDSRLHACITATTGNSNLVALCDQLNARATLGFGSEPYPEDYLARARQEHEELVGCIVRQDSEGAYRSAHHHFALTFDIMKDGLRRAMTRAPHEGPPADELSP